MLGENLLILTLFLLLIDGPNLFSGQNHSIVLQENISTDTGVWNGARTDLTAELGSGSCNPGYSGNKKCA
jgi:hypothetical protein